MIMPRPAFVPGELFFAIADERSSARVLSFQCKKKKKSSIKTQQSKTELREVVTEGKSKKI